jgi:hypothetical protein
MAGTVDPSGVPERIRKMKSDFRAAQSAGSCFPLEGRALCGMGFAPNILKSVKLAMRRDRSRATLAVRVGVTTPAPKPPQRPKPAPLAKQKPAA